MTPVPIRIAAALPARYDQHILLVRKRGSAFFMQPGGKIEACEAPCLALRRELHEELGLSIDPAALASTGRFAAPAAYETGAMVDADMFRLDWTGGALAPKAEIAEIARVDPANTGERVLAPLTRDHVLPLCRPGRTP